MFEGGMPDAVQVSPAQCLTCVVVLAFLALYLVPTFLLHYWYRGIPLVGSKYWFEPRELLCLKTFQGLGQLLDEGYAKFKATPFRFARNDADMIILPNKFVDEIRDMPTSVANPTAAHIHNLLGQWTRIDILAKGDLHFRVIQRKITPNLNSLVAPLQDELEFALKHDLPPCKGNWVAIHPYHTILQFVARVSARIFVGLPICRTDEWLEISTQFTENVFITLLALRMFPTWAHPLVAPFIPSRRKLLKYVNRAKEVLVPELRRRQKELSEGENEKVKGNLSLMQWMIEAATAHEQDPQYIAHIQTVITLASIHTSQMNAVHVMYDLAANPQYIEPLREEIREIAKQDGGWRKASYSKLKKLDSLLRESQRFNPPSILSLHRLMQQTTMLSDGTVLEKGAHIAMAVNKIQNDPQVTPEPTKFDPFRWARMRERPGEGHLHQFASVESDKLNWGYGKYACPGRFFASIEIKSILVSLLMNYDIKLMPGQGRPANLRAYEFIFPNPDGQLLMREREHRDNINFRPLD